MPYRLLVPQRRLEWWLAAYTIVWGLFLIAAPGAFDPPSYVVARLWAPPLVWGCAAATIGLFHAWALYIDGRAFWSAYVRTLATICNAAVFTLMFAAMIAAVWHGFAPASATVAIYAAPVWASICAFWVAAHDAHLVHCRRRRADA